MKTLIIVSSTYLGNTMKVAKVMAHELNAILLTVREAEGHDIASYDLIGLGSGINFASHDKYIISLTERLNLSDKRVFIFSTRCRPFLGMYHKKLKSAVINRGGIVSVEFSCRGFDRTGPWVGINGYNKNRPDSNDIFRASLFAAGIKKKTHPIYHFRKYVTVSKSYKGLPVRIEGAAEVIGDIVMINNSECISCGKCIKSCPLNVFVREKETEKIIPQGQKNCIMCGKCEKVCPNDSVFVNESFLNGLRIMFREISCDKLQKSYAIKLD